MKQIYDLDTGPEWQKDLALRDKSDGGGGVNDRTADAQRYEVAMGDGILCFDNQIAFYSGILEDAIDPASCPIAVHERYEGFASKVCRFDIGAVRESVPRRQYTRANRTQEGAGGHSRHFMRTRRKADIELLVRNQLPDGRSEEHTSALQSRMRI